ncbi:putative cytochrome P450 [Podospora didyma]|uniref:Cytochrome P450 n=1 Tax=Podospora didyma TaxID=330526 RepID=A0AAE0NST0_9PEZI|nr:putative cytochrome P450 [Podospora didyma]
MASFSTVYEAIKAPLVLTGNPWTTPVVALVILTCAYSVSRIVYNLFFHPLAKFPGPKFAAFSNAPFSYWFNSGRQPYKILDLHRKYGPVVRVAPNELSFNSAQSWQDIYNYREDNKVFMKGSFYEGGSFATRGYTSIVTEPNPKKHHEMRRLLSHSFSQQSLSEQESLIAKTIDKLVLDVVGTRGKQQSGFDISRSFAMMTFDIIGDLSFGETFGCIENDKFHPWIEIILGALTQLAVFDTFKRFPIAGGVVALLLFGKIKKLLAETWQNEEMAIDSVNRRIARKTTRKDLMTRVLEKRNPAEVSDTQLAAHAADIVLAGSDTSSTALATTTYYLLQNSKTMSRLQHEIRSTFHAYDEICDKSTVPLPYLKAVILEGLRLVPPLPLGLPRNVWKGGAAIGGHFVPGGTIVSTNPLAATLDPANFTDPMAFKPERWMGQANGDNLEAAQPFSVGPRSCLGKTLAWMEMRTTLAKIIWMYDLELVDSSIDWHRDSEMRTLWHFPKLMVRATKRAGKDDQNGGDIIAGHYGELV